MQAVPQIDFSGRRAEIDALRAALETCEFANARVAMLTRLDAGLAAYMADFAFLRKEEFSGVEETLTGLRRILDAACAGWGAAAELDSSFQNLYSRLAEADAQLSDVKLALQPVPELLRLPQAERRRVDQILARRLPFFAPPLTEKDEAWMNLDLDVCDDE